MIKIDENDPVGEIEPSFPYRDVIIKRDTNVKQFYDLQDEIGRGKFGTVYRCQEKSTGLKLAAKFVNITKRQDRRNAEREVEIMKELQHPRLIQIYDAYEANNVMCVILELIEGGELFERVIDDDFILTEKSVAVFMRQICEGIEFIHSKNVIHLDMKPENILCLTRTGNRIKIIDFGLARKYDPEKKLQVLFGTPEFVAPEVVNFDSIGFGTDMWSVGVICYVLLSGLSPFMGETDVQTMANVTLAQYDFDDEAFNDISEDAKDFIRKLLLKRRQDRMSASECLAHRWLLRKSTKPTTTNVTSTSSTSVDGNFVTNNLVLSNELDYSKNDLRNLVNRWNDDVPTIPCLANGDDKHDEIDSVSAGKSCKADEKRPTSSNACMEINQNVAATSSGKNTIQQPTVITSTATNNNGAVEKHPNAHSVIPVMTERDRERGIIELTDNNNSDRNLHASVANSDTALINNIDCNNNNKERVEIYPSIDKVTESDSIATSCSNAAVKQTAIERRITENSNDIADGESNIFSGSADKFEIETSKPSDGNVADIRTAGTTNVSDELDRNAPNVIRKEIKSDRKLEESVLAFVSDQGETKSERKPVKKVTVTSEPAEEVNVVKNEIKSKLTSNDMNDENALTPELANDGMRTIVENETESKKELTVKNESKEELTVKNESKEELTVKNESKPERIGLTENEAKPKGMHEVNVTKNGTRSERKLSNNETNTGKNEVSSRRKLVNKVIENDTEPEQRCGNSIGDELKSERINEQNIETRSERKSPDNAIDTVKNEKAGLEMKSSSVKNVVAGREEYRKVAPSNRTTEQTERRSKTHSVVTKRSKLFDKIDMFEQSGRRNLNDFDRYRPKAPSNRDRTTAKNVELSRKNESEPAVVNTTAARRSDNDNVELGKTLPSAGNDVTARTSVDDDHNGDVVNLSNKRSTESSIVTKGNADNDKAHTEDEKPNELRKSTGRVVKTSSRNIERENNDVVTTIGRSRWSNSEHRVAVAVEENRVPINGELRIENENDTVAAAGRAELDKVTKNGANVNNGSDDASRAKAKCGLVTVIDDRYEVKRKKSLIIKNISEVTAEAPKLVITHEIKVEKEQEDDDRARKSEKSCEQRVDNAADHKRKIEMRKVRSIDEALIELTKAALEFRNSFENDFPPMLADRRVSDVSAHIFTNGLAASDATVDGPPRTADWFTREIKKFSEKVKDSSSSSSSPLSSSDRKQHELAASGSPWSGTRRPKFKLTCLNRDVPFGGPNLNYYKNLFSHLPNLDRSMCNMSTSSRNTTAPPFHSEPGSPRLSSEKNNSLTREILSRLFDDWPTAAENRTRFVFSPSAAYRTEQDG